MAPMEFLTENVVPRSVSFPCAGSSSRRLLVGAVLAALAVRLIVVALVYPGFLVPGREHWQFGFEEGKIARSIAIGHGFGTPYYGPDTGPTAEVAPVFPYIMAGIFIALGIYTKASALAILSLNSLFSALTCIPIFYMARRSFGLRAAVWATSGWVVFPYAIYFSADSMWDHALVTLLLSCIVWMALELRNRPHKLVWAAFGLLCGVTALVDPIVLGVVPILGAWACLGLRRQNRPWLSPPSIAVIVMCVVIAPWLVRNDLVFGRPVFLKDNLPLAFCVGNVGNALHWWNPAEHPSGNPAELTRFDHLGEQAYMASEWMKVREFIEKDPGTFFLRSVRRFVYVWTGYWSLNREYLRVEQFDPEDIPFRTCLTVLALIGLWKIYRRNANRAVPYVLILIFFPLVYYVTEPDIAYRQPIDPELVMLACCAFFSASDLQGRRAPATEDDLSSSEPHLDGVNTESQAQASHSICVDRFFWNRSAFSLVKRKLSALLPVALCPGKCSEPRCSA